jgi:cytidylate kinase
MAKNTSKQPVKIRRPKPGSKAEAILTLATTAPTNVTEMARLVDTTKSNVSHVLARYGIEPKLLDTFTNNRASLWAAAQEKDLAIYLSLSPEERKKRILTRGLVDAAIAADKEMQARGLGDGNRMPLVVIMRGDNIKIDVNQSAQKVVDDKTLNDVVDIQSNDP